MSEKKNTANIFLRLLYRPTDPNIGVFKKKKKTTEKEKLNKQIKQLENRKRHM